MSSWPTKTLLGAVAMLGTAAFAMAETSTHSGMHREMQAAPNQPMGSHGSHAADVKDGREMVQFPPDMQANFLGNMRDHLQTLNDIVDALAKDDYAAASKAATERLGLNSPSAAGCKPKPKEQASQRPTENKSKIPMTMDKMMEAYMPEAMRGIGLSMHTAASEFAKVATTHDRTASMTALSPRTASPAIRPIGCAERPYDRDHRGGAIYGIASAWQHALIGASSSLGEGGAPKNGPACVELSRPWG